MKFLTKLPVILICLLFVSAKPATLPKNLPVNSPKACTYAFNIDNSNGARTVSVAKIEWPGGSFTYYPNLAPGLTVQYFVPVNISFPMKYAVKVTLSWSSSVPGPKLQLYANSPYTLIGSFNSTANLSTAIVNGTNASGPTAFYCQGVTVIIDQSI